MPLAPGLVETVRASCSMAISQRPVTASMIWVWSSLRVVLAQMSLHGSTTKRHNALSLHSECGKRIQLQAPTKFLQNKIRNFENSGILEPTDVFSSAARKQENFSQKTRRDGTPPTVSLLTSRRSTT